MFEQWNMFCDAMQVKFGDNWRHELKITIRGDTLSWFIKLIEMGIEAQTREWRNIGLGKIPRQLDASEIASIGSWKLDLARMVDQALVQIAKAKKPKQ